MPTVKRFEELTIWQDARKQCQEINTLVQGSVLKDDYSLRGQIERSSGSVMDNIAQGFDRFTKRDFRHFLVISRGSNAELRSQLYRVIDKGHCSKEKIEQMVLFSETLSIKITAFIRYLDSSVYDNKPNTGAVSDDDSITYQEEKLIVPED